MATSTSVVSRESQLRRSGGRERALASRCLVANTWEVGDGRFGVLVDVAYNEYSSNADFFRMEPFYRKRVGDQDRFIPGGIRFGNDAFKRTGEGLSGVQWAAERRSHAVTRRVLLEIRREAQRQRRFRDEPEADCGSRRRATFDDGGFLVSPTTCSSAMPTRSCRTVARSMRVVIREYADIESDHARYLHGVQWKLTERFAMRGAVSGSCRPRTGWSYDTFPCVAIPDVLRVRPDAGSFPRSPCRPARTTSRTGQSSSGPRSWTT